MELVETLIESMLRRVQAQNPYYRGPFGRIAPFFGIDSNPVQISPAESSSILVPVSGVAHRHLFFTDILILLRIGLPRSGRKTDNRPTSTILWDYTLAVEAQSVESKVYPYRHG